MAYNIQITVAYDSKFAYNYLISCGVTPVVAAAWVEKIGWWWGAINQGIMSSVQSALSVLAMDSFEDAAITAFNKRITGLLNTAPAYIVYTGSRVLIYSTDNLLVGEVPVPVIQELPSVVSTPSLPITVTGPPVHYSAIPAIYKNALYALGGAPYYTYVFSKNCVVHDLTTSEVLRTLTIPGLPTYRTDYNQFGELVNFPYINTYYNSDLVPMRYVQRDRYVYVLGAAYATVASDGKVTLLPHNGIVRVAYTQNVLYYNTQQITIIDLETLTAHRLPVSLPHPVSDIALIDQQLYYFSYTRADSAVLLVQVDVNTGVVRIRQPNIANLVPNQTGFDMRWLTDEENMALTDGVAARLMANGPFLEGALMVIQDPGNYDAGDPPKYRSVSFRLNPSDLACTVSYYGVNSLALSHALSNTLNPDGSIDWWYYLCPSSPLLYYKGLAIYGQHYGLLDSYGTTWVRWEQVKTGWSDTIASPFGAGHSITLDGDTVYGYAVSNLGYPDFVNTVSITKIRLDNGLVFQQPLKKLTTVALDIAASQPTALHIRIAIDTVAMAPTSDKSAYSTLTRVKPFQLLTAKFSTRVRMGITNNKLRI